METFEQATKMLEKVEELIGNDMIQFYFYSDGSGSVLLDTGYEPTFLFSFGTFEEIEAEFVEWQERDAENIALLKRRSGGVRSIGGCG